MDTIKYYFYYLSSIFTGFPLVIKIALGLIFIMGSLYIISWLSIGRGFYNRRIEMRRRQSLNSLLMKIEELLLSDEVLTERDIIERLSLESNIKEWEKIYISEFLVDEVDSGAANQNNLGKIVQILDLPEYWEGQLESGDMSKRWKAIRMMDSLSAYIPSSIISKHAAVSREGVGKYAKSVFTKFESHDAFKFLEEELGENLNELDKLRIHNALKERPAAEVLPHLLRTALTTSNEDYQIFLIKEVGLLGLTDGVDSLLDLFKDTHNPEVKAAIVHTLSVLKYREAVPLFIKDYNFTKPIVQEEIIEAMGRMGQKEALDFLEKVYHQTTNKELLIKILVNIHKIEGVRAPVFNRLRAQNKNNFNNTIFAFVENQYA